MLNETVSNPKIKAGLHDLFRHADMSDLPAMAGNVQELLSLLGNSRSAARDLAEVILRDYTLTNMVLQVVNSAYFGRPRVINNVTRAVTVLGFDVIRELAAVIALFENFVKVGVDKDGVKKVLTRSLLSGLQAKLLVAEKKIKIDAEEAFICALLHNLGHIVVQVYLPELYREIEAMVQASLSIEAASRQRLKGLSFQDIGQEMARTWKFSPRLIGVMTPYPPEPANADDQEAYYQNIAAFTNNLTDRICSEKVIVPLLKQYFNVFGLDRDDALKLVEKSVDMAEEFSNTARAGLQKLKMRSCLSKFM